MALTQEQCRTLSKALLGAFPTRHVFDQMVRAEFGENLIDLMGFVVDLETVVVALVIWAEVNDRANDLIRVALATLPDDPELAAAFPKHMWSTHRARLTGLPIGGIHIESIINSYELTSVGRRTPAVMAALASAALSAGPRTQVFISYSRKDRRWLERLHTHLRPLVRQSTIDLWDDTQITPGADWRAAIAEALTRARVAVLLVTPDFLASEFVATEELPKLLDAAGREGLTILWVAVRPSAYKQSPIGRYQAVNDPARPLSRLSAPRIDEALVAISEAITQLASVPTNDSHL